MFPEEQILIARGKQYTLKKERWAQIERIQKICRTVQGNATLILLDCQKRPPEDSSSLHDALKALGNAVDARQRIVELNNEIEGLESEAWPK